LRLGSRLSNIGEIRREPAPWGDHVHDIRARQIARRHSGDGREKSLHRSLGAFQLTMLGIGAVIGTGIFVLTAEAAQKAGPGMMVSFIIAGFVCAVAALCYAEMAAMVPVSGSAYTYSYAVMGELVAWMVGWALILEYAIAAGAVSVGWSGYVVGLLNNALSSTYPPTCWCAVLLTAG
jgi:APA family basic amino acid/polyamine antiporter